MDLLNFIKKLCKFFILSIIFSVFLLKFHQDVFVRNLSLVEFGVDTVANSFIYKFSVYSWGQMGRIGEVFKIKNFKKFVAVFMNMSRDFIRYFIGVDIEGWITYEFKDLFR